MTGTPGWRALSAAMMRCAGATAKSSKSAPCSDPAQLSNSLTTSAPASIWRERYSIVASVSRSMSASKTAGRRAFRACAGPWSGVPRPAIM